MNRRDAILSAGGVFLYAASSQAMAQAMMMHDHEHMHGASPYQALIDATAECGIKGQLCLAHSLHLLEQGDQEMAGCVKTVQQMLALCGALQNLAAQNSPYVGELAKVAGEACQTCEKECRKHEDKHAECKACAESCANCAKQCLSVSV